MLAGQQIGARQAHIGVGDGLLMEIAGSHGQAGNRGGLKVTRGEVEFGERFHFGGRFPEGISVSSVVVNTFAQVVEQDAQFAEIFGRDDEQMNAGPIEIGLRGRSADSDVDAGHAQRGEEFQKAVFERGGHAIGVGVEQQADEFAEDGGIDGGFLGKDDGVAVAAHGERRRRGPAFGILEDEDANGQGSFEIVFADDGAKGVAEFFESDHGFLAGFFTGIGENFEGAGGVADPMVGRREGGGDTDEEESAPHASFYYGGLRWWSGGGFW